jgi:hypothetical protein
MTDFDLTMRVFHRDEVVHDYVGTDIMIASPLRKSRMTGRGGDYSPISADLWAAGVES